eukprot:CAMPEP_0205814756 /NCGR_PEP_ID=MMETSP0205-20121125/20080_1 /ASSEMBLY_ACC=CAM_ASM_000278 /TAXON_ID=36767 /ORGANISM="Euplotes focardii, Strain TN1" /LENGTH=49 /DNA_ID= /DNA_START= /DNA_END= /DNA_ORIENTATION=
MEESKISLEDESDQEWNKMNTFGANIQIHDEIDNIEQEQDHSFDSSGLI